MTITTGLQISSLITPEGELRLTLDDVAIPAPGADQIVVRMEAAPLNPSDLGLLLGPADLSTIAASGTADRPVVTASVNPAFLPSLQARIGEAMAVGNEGAGVVVDAGDNAKDLIGRTVAVLGGVDVFAISRHAHGRCDGPARGHARRHRAPPASSTR